MYKGGTLSVEIAFLRINVCGEKGYLIVLSCGMRRVSLVIHVIIVWGMNGRRFDPMYEEKVFLPFGKTGDEGVADHWIDRSV